MSLFATPAYAAALLMLLLAVAEIISIATRAWLPSMLVAFVGYIALRWTGIAPANVTTVSALGPVGAVLIGVVIAHMGTMIPIDQIRKQWRAIAIALTGMVGSVGIVLAVISPLFTYHVAAASAGPVSGGVVAFLITSEKLKAIGKGSLVVVPALVLALHSLVGMPVANVMLRKYAQILRGRGVHAATHPDAEADARTMLDDKPTHRQLIPAHFATPPILLALMFLLAAVATGLDKLTGVNYGIWALLLGIGAHVVGLVPARTLERANSFGIAMNIIVIVVLASLNSLTPSALAASFVPALAIIGCAIVGLLAGGFLMSKLVGWHPLLGIPVALTALFGFPADYLICQEVSKSIGRTDAERDGIMAEIYTPMLIGGFATVTTSSVLVASILMSTL